MKYYIEIERWKREVCQISVEANNEHEAEDFALNLYLDRLLENDFQDFDKDKDVKDEEITVLDDDGETLIYESFDSNRNVFK